MANPRGQPLKFPTPEKRKEMWQALCDHVSQGYSMKSFPVCDDETCWDYAEKFPDDCPWDELRVAQRKSLLFWERIGTAGATGKLEGFNATSWIFNMKNRAGWTDKIENTNQGPNGGPVQHEVKVSFVNGHPDSESL